MLFTQLEFLFFFAAVLLVTWSVRSKEKRHLVLLFASYYFYAYWDIRFCSLLLFSTVSDFVIGKRMARVRQQRTKRWLLVGSLAVNLGLLGFFKYCNFFIDSAAPLLQALGL